MYQIDYQEMVKACFGDYQRTRSRVFANRSRLLDWVKRDIRILGTANITRIGISMRVPSQIEILF